MRKLISSIAVSVLLLAMVYQYGSDFFLGSHPTETKLFRGKPLNNIDEANGFIVLPTVEAAKHGGVLHSYLNANYIEKLSGVQSPNTHGLELTIGSFEPNRTTCLGENGAFEMPKFEVQIICSQRDFARSKALTKTQFFVDKESKLIVSGDQHNSLNLIFYNGWVASYLTPPMTTDGLKLQACQARVMMDFLFMDESSPIKPCIHVGG